MLVGHEQSFWADHERRTGERQLDEFAVSDEGTGFQTVATLGHDVPQREQGPLTRILAAEDLKVTARYVRVRAASLGTIPDWHHSAGLKVWLFVDEILVNPPH